MHEGAQSFSNAPFRHLLLAPSFTSGRFCQNNLDMWLHAMKHLADAQQQSGTEPRPHH